MSINDKLLDQPNFSLFHSNILYTFFFVSTSLILGADTTLQLVRNGRIATVTMYFAAVFLVNLVLWLDFNYSRTKKEEPVRPRSWLLELMEEDTLASLVVAPLLWMLQRISCCQNNAPTSAGGQDVVVEGGESMMDLDTVSAVRSLAGGSARLLRQAVAARRGRKHFSMDSEDTSTTSHGPDKGIPPGGGMFILISPAPSAQSISRVAGDLGPSTSTTGPKEKRKNMKIYK